MPINASHRTTTVRSLLPDECQRLLDIGCGPVTASYAFADKAASVTCVDWKLQTFGLIPSNVQCLVGDFIELDLPKNYFDVIVAADVFEHILVEREPLFVAKCVEALRPAGYMIVSVPHQGTYAYLDPYRVKPAIHHLLWRLGLYSEIHNGNCDVRKGHKHYKVEELIEKFRPLQLLQKIYYGYLFDPLLTWAFALSRGSGQFPGYSWLERAYRKELELDYGERSFNVALKFCKPTEAAE